MINLHVEDVLHVEEVDGNVRITGELGLVGTTMPPDDARALAHRLLSAAEGAQSFRSRSGGGMPERVTAEEMQNFK